MKRALLYAITILTILLLALCAGPVKANVVGEVPSADGSVILLDSARTVCMQPALDAVHVATDGKRTPGCWIATNGRVLVVFLDADIARIQIEAIKAPKRL